MVVTKVLEVWLCIERGAGGGGGGKRDLCSDLTYTLRMLPTAVQRSLISTTIPNSLSS